MAGRKKKLLGLLALGILMLPGALALPTDADAHRPYYGSFHVGIGPWWGPWYYPWGAYPVYPYPAPVPVPAPCRSFWVEGRWERSARSDDQGFTTYYPVWVEGHWERICP
jgi:hypothetical protein